VKQAWQAFQACFTGSVLASFSGLFHRKCFGKLFRPVSQEVFWQTFQACFTGSVLASFSGLFHRECFGKRCFGLFDIVK
jgi:hypothetical protein